VREQDQEIIKLQLVKNQMRAEHEQLATELLKTKHLVGLTKEELSRLKLDQSQSLEEMLKQ